MMDSPLTGPQGGVNTSRYDADREDLDALIAEVGETTDTAVPSYRVDQLWQGLYSDLVDPKDITTLPKDLREALAERLPAALVEDTRSVGDDGDTVKWLWRLADGSLIETVLMHLSLIHI